MLERKFALKLKVLIGAIVGLIALNSIFAFPTTYAIKGSKGVYPPTTQQDVKAQGEDFCINIECTSVEEIIAKVFIEYQKMLNMGLRYDKSLMGIAYTHEDLVESFYEDCAFLEKERRGVCRHFSNYLILKLRRVGVEAYPLYIDSSSDDIRYGHQAVVYRAGNNLFVADITADIVALNGGDESRKVKPWFYGDNLDKFIAAMKEENNANQIYYLDVDLTDKNNHIYVQDIINHINHFLK